VRVVLNFSDRDWAMLVDRAEAHGLKVPDLLVAAVHQVMPHERPVGDDVLRLVRAGFPDALIGERLGLDNATVKRIRRRAGLPANRFQGRSGGVNGRDTGSPERKTA
jgi:DNA-binding CsgD family transcriptional regulator